MSDQRIETWGYETCPVYNCKGGMIHAGVMDLPVRKCSTCHGTGKVPKKLPPEYWAEKESSKTYTLYNQSEDLLQPIAEMSIGAFHTVGTIALQIDVLKHWPAIRQFFDWEPEQDLTNTKENQP